MSIDATRWAWSRFGLRPAQKLVLLSLADRAGENHTCWPSIRRLEIDTGLDERTIKKALKELCDQGHISRSLTNGRGYFYTLKGVESREHIKKNLTPFKIEGGTKTLTPEMQGEQKRHPAPGGIAPSPPAKTFPESTINRSKTLEAAKCGGQSQNIVLGRFQNVTLSPEEYKCLLAEHAANADEAIQQLSLHKKASGREYHSDFAAILKWALRAVEQNLPPEAKREEPCFTPAQKLLLALEKDFATLQRYGVCSESELAEYQRNISHQKRLVEAEKLRAK